jgi:hypothetical protein
MDTPQVSSGANSQVNILAQWFLVRVVWKVVEHFRLFHAGGMLLAPTYQQAGLLDIMYCTM